MEHGALTLLILAGGKGSRFGGDKGLSQFEGATMIERVTRALNPIVDDMIICVAPGKAGEYRKAVKEAAIVIEDREAFQGPLFGLKYAMSRIRGEFLLLSACDMPFLEPAVYEFLIDRLSGKDAAIPVVGGFLEPIIGVYRMSALRASVRKACDAGERKLSSMIKLMDVARINEQEIYEAGIEPKVFTNINVQPGVAPFRHSHASASVTKTALD